MTLYTLQKIFVNMSLVFGSIDVNNKEVVYGRFVKQIPEFKKKTGVQEIRFTEYKKKGKP